MSGTLPPPAPRSAPAPSPGPLGTPPAPQTAPTQSVPSVPLLFAGCFASRALVFRFCCRRPRPLRPPPPLLLLGCCRPLCPQLSHWASPDGPSPWLFRLPLALPPPAVRVASLPTSLGPGPGRDPRAQRGDPACAEVPLGPCPGWNCPTSPQPLQPPIPGVGSAQSRCDSAARAWHLGFLTGACELRWDPLGGGSRALLHCCALILQRGPSGPQVEAFFGAGPVCLHF